MRKNGWLSLSACCAALALVIAFTLAATGQDFGREQGQWLSAGQNLDNTRSQPSEHRISPANVSALAPKWVFTTGASVSATPTVAGNMVYFPDWAGNIYAVDRKTGKQIWSQTVPFYLGIFGDVTRVSPVVYKDELIFGDNQSNLGVHHGAYLIAVNRFTGALRWNTEIDNHPAAIVTGSAVVFRGVIYQGVSSDEEWFTALPGYPCCSFRGSMVALDANTGQILWKTYDMPDNHGALDQYSGGAIWQPPAIDPARGVLYVGTGNNYTAPASVLACQAGDPNSLNCAAPDDYFDTALALDLRTGAVRWSQRLWGFDVWITACILVTPSQACPSPAGPDYDLGGSGANLLQNLVGFGQKSGIYWALNPANGSLLWGTPVGPGSDLGGIQWGTATDGKRIYAAIANNGHTPYTLLSGQTISWGSWSALDAATGKILWQTADPTESALDMGSVSVANGVLYAGSLSGSMYALDAATGTILWSFASGGSVIDGPSIVDGVVYWGSGYTHGGTGNNKVYAFTVARPESSDN